ncbi:MAG: tetratricopeptide repeat protein [Candidatus Contendobacter sp.]|nr:tetratricopeptide repeat protein [Candidatus Contendobacter sp.]
MAEQGWPVLYAHLPEELPNVSSVAGLMSEIRRFAVGDLSGGTYHFREEALDALDAALATLDQVLDQRFGPGKGLVVAAIENFDELLEKFVRKANRAIQRRAGGSPKGKRPPSGVTAGDSAVELALRGVLERRSNRLMFAISATCNIRNDHPAHPLFQWIKERSLEAWTTTEVLAYALRRRQLAKGQDALLSPGEQIRLKALANFTGGAPRMIAVLVDHLLDQDLEHATLNLAALIDELTPYYKHRMDDLGDECQEVFDALLRGGEPASQTEIAARFTEKPAQNKIAMAFHKLQVERLVVGTREVGGQSKSTLYRATDRVMAYWYKQRQVIGHDPAKSGISHFEEAVELLVGWYSRDDLRIEAENFAHTGRREEAAFLRHLSRHGISRPGLPGSESPPSRCAPRRHLTFGFVLRLELLLRILEPVEQIAGREIIDAFKSDALGDLIKRLDQESRKTTGRWQVFLLCALAVAHALRGATLREDECAEMVLVEALHAAESDVDANILVRHFSALVQFHIVGDIEAAIREVDSMNLESAATLEARMAAQYDAAWVNWRRKDYETSLRLSKIALELAVKLALPAYESRSLDAIAHVLDRLGRWGEALEVARQAVERARQGQDVGLEADALLRVSNVLFKLGRHQESLAEAEKTMEQARKVENSRIASSAFVQQSDCLNALQRSEEALTAARKAETWAQTAFDANTQAEALLQQGSALTGLDRRSEAIDLLRKALELGGDNENLRWRILGFLGRCLGWLGRHEDAIESLVEATALGVRQGSIKARTNDLQNLLIYARQLPGSADFSVSGPKILAAFDELADLDAAKALDFVAVAFRVATALGQYQAFESGLRRAVRKGAIRPDTAAALTRELNRIHEASGRAKGYAAMVSVLTALEPESGEADTASDSRHVLVRGLILLLRDAGLLRDLADFLAERDSATFGAQIDALKGQALYLESGGEQAAIERIDPDLARLYQSMSKIGPLPTRLPQAEDPDLALRPCVVTPTTSTHFAGLLLEEATPATIARFDQLAPNLPITNLEEFDSTKLRAAALPFLPGASLLLLPHRSNGIAVPFVLHAEGLVLAERRTEWIYRLMARRPPLDLSNDTEATKTLFAYLRFLCSVVITSLSGIRLIELPSQIPWILKATEVDRERVSAQVKPMVRQDNERERAVLRVTMLHSDKLWRAVVQISPDGKPEMPDEELLEEDLPIRSGLAEYLVVSD